MSSLGSPNPFFIAGKKAYEVERSLRFNDDDDTNLNRTPSSAGNRRTFTYSSWIKRCTLSGDQQLIIATPSSSATSHIRFDSDDTLNVFDYGTDYDFRLQTTQLFRDPSAWYHIVVAFDTTQSTSSDRVKIYVNGTQVTSLATSNYPSQDHDTDFNNTVGHYFGKNPYYTNRFDGYMAEVNFIDGFQYDASYFGETNAVTGQWNPKKYTGSYGTNGFYLNFSDNSGTTATTLGKDSSGNGNNFTPNNFSVAAGAGNDSLEDTPTNNFATLNILKKPTNSTISNGNLDGSGTANSWVSFFSTILVSSGKWFCEVKVNATRVGVGIGKDGANENSYLGSAADTYSYFDVNGKWNNGSDSSYGATYGANDIIGMALDMDAGTLIFYKNGVSQGTAFTGLSGEFALGFTVYGNGASASINYGQRAFDYTVPTGYKTLCSANLPDPTIKLPNKHFDSLLFTANASTQVVTGLNFQPDWVWGKSRSDNYDHELYDAVRGPLKRLKSNATDQELTDAQNLQSFNSDGFTLGSQTNMNYNSGSNIVAWNWNAGDTDGKTYTVTVVSDSGNKYRFDGFGTSAVTLDLAEGGTYIFNYPSAHPLKFSTTADGTHGGGSEYTTGVTHNSSTQVTIVVAASAPTLYYYCSIHSGMGGQVNTNSTLGSSNFDGSIQSTVKANASSGFSIGLFTGTGSNASIGHGLGVAPSVVIAKSRSHSDNWFIYHKSLGANAYIMLNSTNAADTSNSTVWQNVSPTSSVFYASTGGYNDSGEDLVFYAFSEVAGYSKFGSYTGNGSSNGTFIFTGFRPAWLMIKNTNDGSAYWLMLDNKRRIFNPNGPSSSLYPNENTAENTFGNGTGIDFLSNGFKLRDSLSYVNGSGNTILYLAFAESPFKNARAR